MSWRNSITGTRSQPVLAVIAVLSVLVGTGVGMLILRGSDSANPSPDTSSISVSAPAAPLPTGPSSGSGSSVGGVPPTDSTAAATDTTAASDPRSLAPDPGGESLELESWRSPSGNITCQFVDQDEGGLYCGISDKAWTAPQGASCSDETTLVLSDQPAFVSCGWGVLGAPPRSLPVLAYGSTTTIHHAYQTHNYTLTCKSSEDGMRCVSSVPGAAFSLSRESYDLD
jgi:hypothetical protein